MIRLFRPAYESEATQFLKELKAQRPELDRLQAEGRSRLWDKPPVSLDEQRRRAAADAPASAYTYQAMPVLQPGAVHLAPEGQLGNPGAKA